MSLLLAPPRQRLWILSKASHCSCRFYRSHPDPVIPPSHLLRSYLKNSSSSQIRCISSTPLNSASNRKPAPEYNPKRVRDEEDEEEEEDVENEEDATASQGAYEKWLATQGRQYRYPSYTGPKWLGGDVPFPLNPTFKPPPPLSNGVRTAIYRAYISNPAGNDPRTLSVRYGISIPRVEAILRLKALEAQWRKVNPSVPLQTGFLVGMETLLGIHQSEVSLVEEINSPLRDAVKAADETAAANSAEAETGRKHLSRTYFEPVDEGQEAIVPVLVADARIKARSKQNITDAVSTDKGYPSYVIQPDPHRPAYRFVDIGLKWFDAVDAAKRRKESERRKRIKDRRRESVKNLIEQGLKTKMDATKHDVS